jgi:hypothetical protein
MTARVKAVGALGLIALLAVGCMGPMQISRQFDDWANDFYTREPWWGQFGIIVYPIVMAALFLADFLVLNVINFWKQKDYNGDGTPFKHKEVPLPPDKTYVP